jgi:hypothetical protein
MTSRAKGEEVEEFVTTLTRHQLYKQDDGRGRGSKQCYECCPNEITFEKDLHHLWTTPNICYFARCFTCYFFLAIPMLQVREVFVVEKEVSECGDSNESRQDVEMVRGGNGQEVNWTCQDAIREDKISFC